MKCERSFLAGVGLLMLGLVVACFSPPSLTTNKPCEDGAVRSCYTDPLGCTPKCLGLCKMGQQTCTKGIWSECEGQILRQKEVCDGKDNDCNGMVDEGCPCKEGSTQVCETVDRCVGIQECSEQKRSNSCSRLMCSKESCSENETIPCYHDGLGCTKEGDKYTCLGTCQIGKRRCEGGKWGKCKGLITPQPEICDGKDNDCNGEVDEGLGTKQCGKYECFKIVPACKNGRDNPCVPREATKEICDGQDNDCNGKVDEGCQRCVPSQQTYTISPAKRDFLEAVSPKGEVIAIGEDKDVVLWDTQAQKILHFLRGHTQIVQNLLFSPDGKKLVTSSLENHFVWDVQTGKPLASIKNEYEKAVFMPNNQDIALVGATQITMWDINTNKRTKSFAVSDGTGVWAFRYDGKLFASGDVGGAYPGQRLFYRIRTWDSTTGTLIQEFPIGAKPVPNTTCQSLFDCTSSAPICYNNQCWQYDDTLGHTGEIRSLVFSPDGKIIVSGSSDRTARVWDVATGKLIHTLKGHSRSISTLVFLNQGKILATGTTYDEANLPADTDVRLWDIDTGKLIHTLPGHSCASPRFAYDGHDTLAVIGICFSVFLGSAASWDVKIWDIHKHQLLWSTKKAINHIAFHPDGKEFFGGGWSWDRNSGEPLFEYRNHTGRIKLLAWSPNGDLYLTGATDGKLKVWSDETGELLYSFYAQSSLVAEFLPDGRALAFQKEGGGLVLWDLDTRKPRHTFDHLKKDIRILAFSLDGKLFAADMDDDIVLFDAKTGKQIFSRNVSSPSQLLFSPDSRHLLVVLKSSIEIVDVSTGNLLWHIPTNDGVFAVHFLRRRLASYAEKKIIIWDMDTYKQILSLDAEPTHKILFHPEAHLLASTTISSDGSSKIYLWDLETSKVLFDLPGGANTRGILFQQGGKTLISYGDGGILAWDPFTGKLIHSFTEPQKIIEYAAFRPDHLVLLTLSPDAKLVHWSCPCKHGEQRLCYSAQSGCFFAPDGTPVCQGICQVGKQTCSLTGNWEPCRGAVLPQAEVLQSGKDNNCDGLVE